MPTKMSEEFINAAIDGFKAQRNRLDLRVAELRAMLNGGPAEAAAEPAPRKRRKRRISEEGMKRIIAATKKRWRHQRATMKAKTAKVARRKTPVRKAA